MTVGELRDLLDGLCEEGRYGEEVMIVIQPHHYPLLYTLDKVVIHPEEPDKVLLVEGSQVGYGPRIDEAQEL